MSLPPYQQQQQQQQPHRAGLKESSHLSSQSSKQKRLEKQRLTNRQQKAKLLAKRRKLPPSAVGPDNLASSSTTNSDNEQLRQIVLSDEGSQYLQSLVNELDHEKHSIRIKALKLLRTILSMVDTSFVDLSLQSDEQQLQQLQGEEEAHDQQTLDDIAGPSCTLSTFAPSEENVIVAKCLAIPNFLPLIQKHLFCANNESQLEAAWCITNIASSTHEHTKQVLPCVMRMVAYLENADHVVQEQCAWALGNIAGDSTEYAHFLIRAGILKPLANLFGLRIPDLTRTVIWCLSNIMRGVMSQSEVDRSSHNVVNVPYDPSVFFQAEHDFAPLLVKCLQSNNADIATESAWALSYVTTYPDYVYIPRLLQLNILPIVIHMLAKNQSMEVLQQRVGITIPLLRILGSIARGPDQVIDSIFSSPDVHLLMQALMVQLSCTDPASIQKETVWVLSNLASGSEHCVNMLVQAGFISPLLQLCSQTQVPKQYELKRESLYALMNVCSDSRMMTIPMIANIMKGISHILSLIVTTQDEAMQDTNGNEEFAITCLNFMHFVLHVNSTQVEAQKQSEVKSLIPLAVVQQVQHKFHNHTAYQEAVFNILRYMQ